MEKILVVLQRFGVSSGLTSFYMNYYLLMENNDYQIDFLLCREEDSPYHEIVKNKGSNVYIMPKYKNNRDLVLYKYIYRLINDGKYTLIHVNIADFRAAVIMSMAKICKVPYRVYHSHNTLRAGEAFKSRALSRIYDFICVKAASSLLACTDDAGKSVFGRNNFEIIRNAIHVDKFVFNKATRERIRTELNLSDKFIIGTVCRQAQQKNPLFIIDVLASYNKMYGEAYLLWVGTGPMYTEVQRYAQEKKVLNRLIMVGDQTDVYNWYSAMDVFLMPSLFEGLGIVYIEAQATGLHTFASDCVPKDSKVTELIHYISLEKDSDYWAKSINSILLRNEIRRSRVQEVIEAGYGVNPENNSLKKFYDKQLHK